MHARASLRLAALLGGGLVVVALSCAPDPAAGCTDDDGCDDGQHCAAGTCVAGAEATVRILSLTAEPATVSPGDDVAVRWETRNASACELSPAAGVVPRQGTFTTSVAETTAFVLVCEGPGGPASSTATVTVPRGDGGALDGGDEDASAGLDDGGPDDSGSEGDGGEPDAAVLVDGGARQDAGTDAGGSDAGSTTTARSCSDLRVRHGVGSDGIYPLDPDGPGGRAPFDAWCDMTTDGGGWTLVLKVDGTRSTFRYPAALWTNDELLNEGAVTPSEGEAKLPGYLSLPVDRVRVELDAEGARALSLALSGPSLRALVTSGATRTDEGPEAWGALAGQAPLDDGCLLEGVSVGYGGGLFPGAQVRIGAIGGDDDLCIAPTDFVGVGFAFSLACVSLPTAGSTSSCSGNNSGRPAFANVWVRDEDFTDLPPKASCAAHLEEGRTVSGLYTLSLAGSLVEAYCDMTTDGGGWTLAGASVEDGEAAAFGWRSATGDVRDDDEPYSLGALSLGHSFDQALVGRRGTGKGLRSNAYRVSLPEGFFTEEGKSAAYSTTTAVPVLGACAPVEYSMLRHWGHTALTTHFHIRDSAPATSLGLRPSGLSMWYEGCDQGALLDGTQGLLFVR